VRILVAGVLLAGPTALAFDSGGFFDSARTVAGLTAWALVVVLAVTGAPLPRARAAWLAIGGLAALTAWAAVSIAWAPLDDPARDDVGRLIAYTGALTASALAWRDVRELRLVEPALAAGALIVVLYGLSGRLLPGLIDLDESATAGGRLEQPLTYWNALGLLAALGLTLATRVAGTPERSRALRAAAAASAVPFGMAIYLTFSRGAIAAAIVGLGVLLALQPTPAQLRAVVRAGSGALAAAVVVSLLPAVEGLGGGSASATTQGAIALIVLVCFSLSEVFLSLRDTPDRTRSYALPPRTLAVAIGLVVVVGVPLAAVALDSGEPEREAAASRLNNLGSNRYDYWGVALDAFVDDPLQGTGTAGFRVDWLRDRDIEEPVRDAHSLYLETLGELGLEGFLFLGLFIGGVTAAGVTAVRRERELVAGAAAGASVFAVHAAIDWDWEMPAVTLPALVLAGVLLCRATPTTAAGRTG
jgi:hypothetical protein